MSPEYSAFGIVTIGSGFFAVTAGAKLKLSDEELMFSVMWRKWIFPRSSVMRLRLCRYRWRDGFVIEHTVERYTSFIFFSSWWLDEIKTQLRSRGYAMPEAVAVGDAALGDSH